MLLPLFSFTAGVVVAATVIRLYPMLKNSQLAELIIIAVRNRWLLVPGRSAPLQAPEQLRAEKERAMAAGLHNQ